ncbi:AP-1 complex subunit mu-1 [Mycena venus]|uniref:AP-1 complex subunit mu-1 n=1 Tax=Mycena venus TaxID=2733690 RepID=A0A8H6U4E5_9AGAR|nr:AP-1 complex subunit mu-1 [Mycena venus]
MASLIAILDVKGKTLIQRCYRDDLGDNDTSAYVERFMPLMMEMEEEGQPVPPCFSSQGINYMHIRHSNLYLLALSSGNINAGETIVFLHQFVRILVEYFKALEEESIRDNFVIIYELMDEMMDFGYPQVTEVKMLHEFITQESNQLAVQIRPPTEMTGAVSWRQEGIRYKKNEVFLDVVESVNLLVNAAGDVVRSEILGVVKMRCYLSGMPELRLGLNDKAMFESTGRTARGKAIEMEDVQFHHCVRLSRFENDRTISFIPPDGDFDLMTYRLSTIVKPLVWVEAEIERHSGTRVVYMVKVIAQFKRRSKANNVEVFVPVDDDADTPEFRARTTRICPVHIFTEGIIFSQAANGKVTYVPDRGGFVWTIKQLAGGKEFMMRAQFGLPTVRNEQDARKRAPVTVKYEIPYFTVSGIQVRYLKVVEKSGYQALPWVRYITQNGDDYSLRTAHEKGSPPIRQTA